MSKKYNAFISYRHKPLDLEVAARLQRYLENFNFIKKRKKSEQLIRRIFRDKDELPTSYDLKNSIYDALSNSEYLIVICSGDTKESLYVREEIEYFLKISDVNHIIVVRIKGELQETLPDPLKKYYTIGIEDGITETFCIVDICGHTDSDTIKLLKTEYLQIVSLLIRLPEDQITEKHYRIRLASAAALYALFIGVFFIIRGIYSDKFTKAAEMNNELSELQSEISHIQQNINILRNSAGYWCTEVSSDLIPCLQFEPGCKDVLKDLLEQNIEVLTRLSESDDTGIMTEKLVTSYAECERLYLTVGDYDKAVSVLHQSLNLWDKIEEKYPSIKSRQKGNFVDQIIHAFSSKMENEEIILKESQLLYTKAEQLRISAIMYGNRNDYETEYQYCLDAYHAIEQAVQMDSQAYNLSEKASICRLTGVLLEYLGRFSEAKKFLSEACDCYLQCITNDQGEIYRVYHMQALIELAGCCYFMNDTAEAENTLENAFNILNHLKEPEDDPWYTIAMASAYSGIERIYLHMHQYRKAMEFGLTALKLNQKIYKDVNDNDSVLSQLDDLLMLCNGYLNLSDYENFKKYSGKVSQLLDDTNDTLAKSSFGAYQFEYYRLLTLYHIYGNDISAAKKLNQTVLEYAKLPDQKSNYYILCNLISMCEQNPKEAQDFCIQAQKSMESISDKKEFAYGNEMKARSSVIKAYHAIACIYQGNTELAVSIAEESYSQAYEEQKMLCTIMLAFAYRQAGEIDKAEDILKDSADFMVPGTIIVQYNPVKTINGKTASEAVDAMEAALAAYHKGG